MRQQKRVAVQLLSPSHTWKSGKGKNRNRSIGCSRSKTNYWRSKNESNSREVETFSTRLRRKKAKTISRQESTGSCKKSRQMIPCLSILKKKVSRRKTQSQMRVVRQSLRQIAKKVENRKKTAMKRPKRTKSWDVSLNQLEETAIAAVKVARHQ